MPTCKPKARALYRSVYFATAVVLLMVVVVLATGLFSFLGWARPLAEFAVLFTVAFTMNLMVSVIRGVVLPGPADLYLVRDGAKVYRLRGMEDCPPDGYAVAFPRRVVVWGSNITKEVVRHEIRHTKHWHLDIIKSVYIAAVLLPLVYSLPTLSIHSLILAVSVILLGVVPVLWAWKAAERDADLYGFRNAQAFKKNVREVHRPKSRLRRLLRWLFSTHPPPWVRASERYYDKRESLWRLFAEDLRR